SLRNCTHDARRLLGGSMLFRWQSLHRRATPPALLLNRMRQLVRQEVQALAAPGLIAPRREVDIGARRERLRSERRRRARRLYAGVHATAAEVFTERRFHRAAHRRVERPPTGRARDGRVGDVLATARRGAPLNDWLLLPLAARITRGVRTGA